MSFLHETLWSYDPEYRSQHAAEQAIIDGQNDLKYEIRKLRQDLARANFEVSDRLAEVILNIMERLAQS